MGNVRLDITMSLDGFVAAPNIGIDHPIGEGGERLHDWLFQGDYVDRRMMYFSSMDDVTAKRSALEHALKEWVKLMDDQEQRSGTEIPATGEHVSKVTSDDLETDFPVTSKPAQRALVGAGYTRLEQLASVSEAELLKLHGMGPKALGILQQALAKRGLAFADRSKETQNNQ